MFKMIDQSFLLCLEVSFHDQLVQIGFQNMQF